jgi:hypothetical protein
MRMSSAGNRAEVRIVNPFLGAYVVTVFYSVGTAGVKRNGSTEFRRKKLPHGVTTGERISSRGMPGEAV